LKLEFRLGAYQEAVEAALKEADEERVLPRLRARDHTLWKPDPADIANRLGWLDAPETMVDRVGELKAFAEETAKDGFTRVLLMGMGGSSLAAAVIRSTFGVKKGFPDLAVLDSTVPAAVLNCAGRLDIKRTLFIVSTKSGDTVETISFFKYFFSRAVETSGTAAGRQFIAITDPGSPLVERGLKCDFRRIFLNDPSIGGRYSALSLFGLVPAALIGVDPGSLLEDARSLFAGDGGAAGVKLGVVLGELAAAGRDKMSLSISPALPGLGDWVEQLIAESTGKEGRGILPIPGESPAECKAHGNDIIFIYISIEGETLFDDHLKAIEDEGHPAIRILIADRSRLGSQFLLWEIATAAAGWRLGINPFDQPDVEAAKEQARRMTAEYLKRGSFPGESPAAEEGALKAYGNISAESPEDVLSRFLSRVTRKNYIALQAFVEPKDETGALLSALSNAIRQRCGTSVTVGYGPRYLHSTGQLHKGDGGHGMFIQFTADDPEDVPIPGDDLAPSALTFGALKYAQAMGDRKALENAGRPVIRFHLGHDVPGGLKRLTQAVKNTKL